MALPTEIFFRTGIGTHLWILSNKKPAHRRGRVPLINATGLWTSIKNEGNKRRIVSDEQRRQIADVYAAAKDVEISRMVDYRVFGYRRIKGLRPLRMAFHINAESLARLKDEKAWVKLTVEQQAAWEDALQPYLGAIQALLLGRNLCRRSSAVVAVRWQGRKNLHQGAGQCLWRTRSGR